MTEPLQYNPEILEKTVAQGATRAELELFITQCQRTGLDPYARQINLMLRRSKDKDGNWTQKATIMVSIDGARLVAARTGLYNGSHQEWCDQDGLWKDVWLAETPPAAARTTVLRGPAKFSGIALWREYGATASGPLWRAMPAHMLSKCSEMLGLRKAFPAELSGLYSTDEMAQAADQIPTAEAPPPAPATPAPSQNGNAPIQTIAQFTDHMRSLYPDTFNTQTEVISALKSVGVTAWPRKITSVTIQNLQDKLADIIRNQE